VAGIRLVKELVEKVSSNMSALSKYLAISHANHPIIYTTQIILCARGKGICAELFGVWMMAKIRIEMVKLPLAKST